MPCSVISNNVVIPYRTIGLASYRSTNAIAATDRVPPACYRLDAVQVRSIANPVWAGWCNDQDYWRVNTLSE